MAKQTPAEFVYSFVEIFTYLIMVISLRNALGGNTAAGHESIEF